MGRESHLICYFRNVYLVVYQQISGLFESYRPYKVAWGYVHGLLQLTVEMYSAHADFAAQFLDAEIGVFDVLADYGYDL